MRPVPIYSIVMTFSTGREFTLTSSKDKAALERHLNLYKDSKFKHEIKQTGVDWE